jgi:hypothetical protein
MFPDAEILERRVRQVERLPWPIPALMLLEISDEDLDDLDAAEVAGRDEYWHTLNRIVRRIQAGSPTRLFGPDLTSRNEYIKASERRQVDIESGERVEGELDGFISKQDKRRRRDEGERAREELYLESTRRHTERQQLRLWWEWLRFHEGQVRRHTANLEALIVHHRTEAERYAGLLGVEMLDEIAKRNGHKKGRAA